MNQNMSENNNSFCAKYLRNSDIFSDIKTESIDILCNYGFDCFETLISLDFEKDMPLIEGMNLGQKALIRNALNLLINEYNDYKFDYNNQNDLKSAFDRIRVKVNDRRNLTQNLIKTKTNKDSNGLVSETYSNYSQTINALKNRDLNVINVVENETQNNGVSDQKLSRSYGSLSDMSAREESFGSHEDKSLEEVMDLEEVIKSFADLEDNDNNWLKIKSKMDEKSYEELKKTVRNLSPIILLKRC
jgi:hypothetical protein